MGRSRSGFAERRTTRVALSSTLVAVTVVVFASMLDLGSGEDLETLYAAGTLALPDSLTPDLIALGDSVFHGKAASGVCSACHGEAGAGSRLGPALRGNWVNSDGTLESILGVVRRGVSMPKRSATGMPGFAGAMDRQHLIAVSAYVYSLSNRRRTDGR